MDCAPPPPPPPPPVHAPALLHLPTPATHASAAAPVVVPLSESGMFDLSMSAPISKCIAWDSAVSCSASNGGSSGVFFVELANGERIVVKGSKDPAKEVFMSRVGRHLGLAMPDVRIVVYSDLEYKRIEEMVERLCSGELLWVAKKQLNKPQIIVMEFVRGVGLLHMTPELVERCFNMTKSPDSSRLVCRAIGRTVGLDACVNNWDRCPLVHDNDGNFENIMLQIDAASPHVVSVDNTMTSIRKLISSRPNPMYEKYLSKIKQLVEQLANVKSGSVECALVAQLRERILLGTGIPLSVKEGIELQLGLVQMLCRFHAFRESLPAELVVVKGMVKQAADWDGIFSRDVEGIDLSFLQDIIDVINPHLRSLEEHIVTAPQ